MTSLNLIVYSNEHRNTKLSWNLKGERITEELGIEAHFQILPEDLLPEGKQRNGTPLPQEAVISVHGNAVDKYRNITDTRRLSQARPDLRFIVSIDTSYNKSAYADVEDYDYVRKLLEGTFTPLKSVNVTDHHPGAFISGISTTLMEVRRSLENYLSKWRMMKEGHIFTLVTYYDRDLSDITQDNEELADEIGILYQETQAGEHCLESGSVQTNEPIPQNAVVLVHGNATSRYQNIYQVRQLTEKRPDLHFIVTVDESTLKEGYFQTPEDYQLVRSALEQDFSAAQKVAVTTANPLGFMRGKDLSYSIECSLENYMRSWKKLRGIE